jgi:hypothetical protein
LFLFVIVIVIVLVLVFVRFRVSVFFCLFLFLSLSSLASESSQSLFPSLSPIYLFFSSLHSSTDSSLQRPFFPDTFGEIDYKSARSIGIDKGFLTLVSKSKSDPSFKSYNVFPPLISHPFFPGLLNKDARNRCASFMRFERWSHPSGPGGSNPGFKIQI